MKSSIEIYLDTLRSVSEEAKEFFREKHLARENALQLSRQMVQLSSKTIRSAHRGEFDEAYRLFLRDRKLDNGNEKLPDVPGSVTGRAVAEGTPLSLQAIKSLKNVNAIPIHFFSKTTSNFQ